MDLLFVCFLTQSVYRQTEKGLLGHFNRTLLRKNLYLPTQQTIHKTLPLSGFLGFILSKAL